MSLALATRRGRDRKGEWVRSVETENGRVADRRVARKGFVLPRPRFRPSGTPWNYRSVARDLLLGRIRKTPESVREVESRVADYVGRDYAVAMPRNRVGIYLTLRALLREKREVVLSPYTIYDVINMVLCAGGKPVFADIERQTCNIDPQQIEELINESTGAVLITHLHGLACDVEPIAAVCRRAAVPMLEDAAQAFGARVDGRHVGTFGAAGIFSFGFAKNVNSFYGGMVTTNDEELAARLRDDVGRVPLQEAGVLLNRVAFCMFGDALMAPGVFQLLTYWVFRYGYLHDVEAIKSRVRGEDDPQLKREVPEEYLRRMTPMQARLIIEAMGRVEEDRCLRTELARVYDEGLRDVPDIILPPMRNDGSHVYLSYPIQVPDRHELLRFLTVRGRDLSVQHLANNADAKCYSDYHRDCPNARKTALSVLLLPVYPGYGRRQAERNVALIRKYFGG
jgi:dTDP-4-amino-4,6-dideoxygalactose transaminase